MIGTLFRNEIRMLLRDTRTVLIAVVAPLVLFPAFIFVSNWVEEREATRLETRTYEVAVAGERRAWVEPLVRAAIARDPTVEPAQADGAATGDVLLPAEEAGDEPTIRPADFEWVETDRPAEALADGDLHLVVWAVDAEPADSLAEGTPLVRLDYRADSDFSRNARDRMRERLEAVRADLRDSTFQASGFPVPVDRVAPVRTENVASAQREAGSFLGGILVPFLVLLMLSGGSIVAADSISGEKERGTLETLLTTAASRSDIVQAKLQAIMAVGLAVAVVNVLNIGVYIGLGVFDLPETLQIGVDAHTLGALFILLLPLVALVAAALLLLSGISKSYKEYQVYFLPLFLVFLVPSLAAFLPGIEQESAIVLVPVSGIAVSTRALLMGDWHLSWGLASFASTALAAWLLLGRTEATLSNERLITQAQSDEADFRGGAALYPRHVVRWFLGMWVVFFLASLWFGESLGIRGQVVLNLAVIFTGGSILILRRYDLDVRETLQLHMPAGRVWPAVVLAAPCVLLLVGGLGNLINTYVFPVPESMLEAFGESLTGGLPWWQLVFFIAIMPGVLEEIAFRGVLFTGLRKRLSRPWMAVLLSGAIFGFFHVSLFRLIPTGILGVVLAVVVLQTGSLYPAMLWHFLNNLTAVAVQEGWIPLDPEVQMPLWAYGVALVGAVGSWLVLRSAPRPPQALEPGPRGSPPSAEGRIRSSPVGAGGGG